MKTRIFLLAIFTVACSYSYGQITSKRSPLKMVHLDLIDTDDPYLFIKKLELLPTKEISEEKIINTIWVGCRLPISVFVPVSFNEETINTLHTPRRDISAFVLLNGGIIEKPNGEYSIRGSRNQPIAFVDDVKTRGLALLPAAAISHVEVLKGGIPADLGDSNSGIIQIYSLPIQR